MRFQVKDILEATGGKLLKNSNILGCFSISTDTRTISPEEIFLPLIGPNFDGHNFINTALEKGCRGYIIDNNHTDKISSCLDCAKFIIAVDNTLEAYLKIANYARLKINPVVVAITGSSGKTTTKELCFSVLSQQYKTHKSLLNHNNEVGLCQTMLNMPDDTEFLVVEMGMRGPGEIELLSKYAEPDIAVITNIGTAHIGRLGSIENIARAKCEIVKHLNKEGCLIAFDDKLIKNHVEWTGKTIYYSLNDHEKINIVSSDSEGSSFVYKENIYKINVSGHHNILNSLAAIELGLISGMTPLKINQGLDEYKPIDNRGKITELADNIKIINDSYNANPDSVKVSIEAVLNSYKNSKIILVLGDMAELGDHEYSLHKEVGEFISDKSVFELITVGEKAKIIADNITNSKIKVKSFTQNNEAVQYLRNNLLPDSVVLLKASRCMSFENIAEQLGRIEI